MLLLEDYWNYIQECNHIYGMLSPFGWGEICYRDFEATLGGNLLLKPNMDHIKTWPNIYTEDSYFKLDWNYFQYCGIMSHMTFG